MGEVGRDAKCDATGTPSSTHPIQLVGGQGGRAYDREVSQLPPEPRVAHPVLLYLGHQSADPRLELGVRQLRP